VNLAAELEASLKEFLAAALWICMRMAAAFRSRAAYPGKFEEMAKSRFCIFGRKDSM
jgi:hypothetical protein